MGSKAWDFSEHLAKYGPHANHPVVSLTEAQQYCSSVARQHYENFQIASLLLPRPLRQDFHNIYAYCRWSDDLADEAATPQLARDQLHWWRDQVELLFQEQSVAHPVLSALRSTIRRHNLPKAPWLDLISAFEQDQDKTRYETFDDLRDYCRRSANPVGRLILGLAGIDLSQPGSQQQICLSDEICTGLQLANFCQDMRRDAQIGRIYAPRQLWLKHNVTEEHLLSGSISPQLKNLLRDFVGMARSHLVAGAELHKMVPPWLSLDVRLFRAGGLAILKQIERADFDVWSSRPTVSKWHKLWLLARALLRL